MATTYTWKITSLRVDNKDDLQNIIYDVRFKITGTDEDGNTGEFRGSVIYDANSVDAENFTPFNELTEEQVIGWVQSGRKQPYFDRAYGLIEKQIERMRNSPSIEEPLPVRGMPWVGYPEKKEQDPDNI